MTFFKTIATTISSQGKKVSKISVAWSNLKIFSNSFKHLNSKQIIRILDGIQFKKYKKKIPE